MDYNEGNLFHTIQPLWWLFPIGYSVNSHLLLLILYWFYEGDKELVGTLRGFDEYVNMVLEDVIEYEISRDGTRRETAVDQILLNGAHICLLVPGGDPSRR